MRCACSDLHYRSICTQILIYAFGLAGHAEADDAVVAEVYEAGAASAGAASTSALADEQASLWLVLVSQPKHCEQGSGGIRAAA